MKGIECIMGSSGKGMLWRQAIVSREDTAADQPGQRGRNGAMSFGRTAYIPSSMEIQQDRIGKSQLVRDQPFSPNIGIHCFNLESLGQPEAHQLRLAENSARATH